jgi:flagellar biosynthesis anti-sigma factor FlgM
MRIDDLNRTPLAHGTEKTDQAVPQRGGTLGKDTVAGSDQADVSPLAQALLGQSASVQSPSVQSPSRIDQLRLEVQSGRYDVSAEAVAGAIIDAHRSE